DCGPCSQLVVDMALDAGVPSTIVQALVQRRLQALPADIVLVLNFTELVLAHDPQADELREKIQALWGSKGLITLAFAISSYRVYATLKYAMGYGTACSQIALHGRQLIPGHTTTTDGGEHHA